MIEQLERVKWIASGVKGHTHDTVGDYFYTSDAPPVEAREYESMKQRAEAAEANVHRISGELGQQRLVSKNLRGDLLTKNEVSALNMKRIGKLQERVKELEDALREAQAEIVQASGSPFVLDKIGAALDGKYSARKRQYR